MPFSLKPTHKPVKDYYKALEMFAHHGVTHETAVRNAFQTLLTKAAKQVGWDFVEEYAYKPKGTNRTLHVDGAMLDGFSITHAWWEAKDADDDLAKEVIKKFDKGYPDDNIIFQSPMEAIIYQKGTKVVDELITEPKILVDVLHTLFTYREEAQIDWERAVEEFKDRIPDYANALIGLIEKERGQNVRFTKEFAAFADLCRSTINPNLRNEAIEEMLIQHLLTKRIFTSVFQNPEFTRRNPVAKQITEVTDALTSRSFSEAEFFQPLERFYGALEKRAKTLDDYGEKQHFLNAVYERFFQGFSVKVADTHGIVYTPQPIVDFMVRSVNEILKKEFGKTLGSRGVHILDPFVGTGNFIMRLMREIPKTELEYKYKHELHCNEVMLLPYYIASMNIEHEYYDLTGNYEPFEGICLVDTFELAEPVQHEMFTEENTERVKKLKETPLFVIIGNPPYNVGQVNENDNNRNRKYQSLDKRIAETYAKKSNATNKNALSDVYVKAYRWASDQIAKNGEGIITFVSNNSFIDDIAFDGMRKSLYDEFDLIYTLDLKGNIRKDSMKDGIPLGEKHTVFGLAAMVGITVTCLIKTPNPSNRRHMLFLSEVDFRSTRTSKFRFLETSQDITGVSWNKIGAEQRGIWSLNNQSKDFENFTPIGTKEAKYSGQGNTVFINYGIGIGSSRDAWVYNFNSEALKHNINNFIDAYNYEVYRWKRNKDADLSLDDFVLDDETKIKWSSRLKECLSRYVEAEFEQDKIRTSIYRPFTSTHLFYDDVLNHRRGQIPTIFPKQDLENIILTASGVGSEKPFMTMVSNQIVDLHLTGAGTTTQCFPFYTYDTDGSNRTENITDWALGEYRRRYGGEAGQTLPLGGSARRQEDLRRGGVGTIQPKSSEGQHPSDQESQLSPPDPSQQVASDGSALPLGGHVEKWDIFYYIYGILHSPEYREKYAANLRRELPRIPYVKSAEDFWAFSEAGKKLAFLHLNYDVTDPSELHTSNFELQTSDVIPEYPLEHIEKEGAQLDWRVEKMRWKDKKEKTILQYNDFLTLAGIPPEAHRYKLGNRSALDWIVDQYRVKTDKRSGITNDPNRPDDPQYIVRLIKKIVTVSLETMKVVDGLPELEIEN